MSFKVDVCDICCSAIVEASPPAGLDRGLEVGVASARRGEVGRGRREGAGTVEDDCALCVFMLLAFYSMLLCYNQIRCLGSWQRFGDSLEIVSKSPMMLFTTHLNCMVRKASVIACWIWSHVHGSKLLFILLHFFIIVIFIITINFIIIVIILPII